LGDLNGHMARLLTALEGVRQQIADSPVAPPAPAPGQLVTSATAAASNAGAPDLKELAKLLAESASRAVDWWHRHEATLANQLDPVALRGLSRAIGRFDFDAALVLCQRIDQSQVGPQSASIEGTLT
ncbi:MAG: hypothetical protein CFE45_32380, partial [Burkholderiales bacterium PBB5]